MLENIYSVCVDTVCIDTDIDMTIVRGYISLFSAATVLIPVLPAGIAFAQNLNTTSSMPHSAVSAFENTTVVATGPKMIVLPPQTSFRQTGNSAPAGGLAPYESVLVRTANSEAVARKYTPVTPEDLRDSEATAWFTQLHPLISRVVKGSINDDARQILGHLSKLPANGLILVQYFRVEAGPGGSWNPISGAITSSMSSMLLQAVLISVETDQITWKNEVLERKLMRADDPKFIKMIESLYQTLPNNEHLR